MNEKNIFINAINHFNEIVKSVEFLLLARLKPSYFSKERKMNLSDLTMFMLNLVKKTLQIELDDFIDDVIKKDLKYTKQAFSQARQKINPKALKYLFDENVKLINETACSNTFHNFRLLAIDGSVITLPKSTKKLKEYFGFWHNENKEVAMAIASGMYDIENNIMIDAIIDRYDMSERNLAIRHLKKLKEYEIDNALVVFDRGYPSKDIIKYLSDNGTDFLIRVTNSFIREVNEVTEDDEIVQFKYKGTYYKLRTIKVKLDTGEIETLITSIFDPSFTPEDFKALYSKRWGIEVKYSEIKNRLQVENFTGETPIAIEQDFYASMYLSNIISLLKRISDKEIEKADQGKELKHRYKTNINILIGKLKNKIILLILETNIQRQLKMLNKLVKEATKNKSPIRPGRNNPRQKLNSRNKYPLNQKSAL